MTYREDAPGVDENPLRGLVPYAKQNSSKFPHSLEWFYMPLSEVVTGLDTYDWSPLEQELGAIVRRGHQAIFRFYVDYPKKPSGIPRYLVGADLKTFPYNDAGNAESATPSLAPDYRLIECFVRFVHALGQKYDGDARIAYVEAGLYGFWGEWHVHDHPLPGEPHGWAISHKDEDALLRAYVESFRRTFILVRYPRVTEDRRLLSYFGFHDDSFLQDTLGPAGWQFWPVMKRFGTTKAWQWRPTGGEIRPELQTALWDKWPNAWGQDVKEAITKIHATWMLDADLFTAPPTTEQQANALRAARMMGYTLYCAAARRIEKQDGTEVVTVRMENRGVAPFYYLWPAELEALDRDGRVVAHAHADWPLPALLPGKVAEWSAELAAPRNVTATVLLRIPNPMPGGHSVALANVEMSTAREGWLTLSTSKP